MINSVQSFSNNTMTNHPNFRGTATITSTSPKQLKTFVLDCAEFCNKTNKNNIKLSNANASVSLGVGKFIATCEKSFDEAFSKLANNFAQKNHFNITFKP